jgi:DNA-binding beta-propeller fold protein YncE
MKAIAAVGVILSVALSAAAFAAAPSYKIVDRIKVPDGGFDYATYDPAKGRVLMARTDFTTAIDVKTGKVSQIGSAAAGHMAMPVPGTTLLLLPQRKGTIRIVDDATDMVVAELPGGKNPDGAAYDPLTKLVFVMNRESAEATVVDPIARKVVATIPIGGSIEFTVSDGAGKVFANDESVGDIAVIDVKTLKMTGRYKMDGCMAPSGLAYVPGAKLLISSCRNGVAKVIQSDTGKEVASLPIGRGPDAVIYDPMRKMAFIPCGGDGVLEVISLADPAHISVVQHVQTQPGSRTGTLDPATGRLYLMASKPDPSAAPPPGGGGAPRLPGSFEVLVIAP